MSDEVKQDLPINPPSVDETDEMKEFKAWKTFKNNIAKVELKPDKVEPMERIQKEKKPRTQAQIDATARMREALLTCRKATNTKKTEHTEKFKQTLKEVDEKADKIRELNPDIKVVVKSRIGRPKGQKNLPVKPTPMGSDDEEEEQVYKEQKALVKQVKAETRAVVHRSSLDNYMAKLNGR